MKNIILFLFLIMFLYVQAFSSGKKPADKLLDGHSGREFWFSPIPLFQPESEEITYAKLYIVSDKPATVRIEIPGRNYSDTIKTKPFLPSSVFEWRAFPYLISGRDSKITDSVYKAFGVHIVSDQSIVVSCLATNNYNVEGFTLLPLDKLGNEYISRSYPEDPLFYIPDKYRFPDFCSITATSDSTHVRFTMSGDRSQQTEGGIKSGTTSEKILNTGDVYLVASKGDSGDLSGSRIISDKPVAVVSGNSLCNIPLGNKWGNYSTEMELPLEYKGTAFPVSTPDGRKHPSIIRIFALDTNTIVYRDGITLDTIKYAAGSAGRAFFESRITDYNDSTFQSAIFTTSKPSMATLYSTGISEDSLSQYTDCPYSPFCSSIIPVERFVSDIAFVMDDQYKNSLQLIYPSDESGSLPDDYLFGHLVKGKLVWDKLNVFYPGKGKVFKSKINGNIYAVRNIKLNYEVSMIRIKSGQPFSATLYGGRSYSQYGFSVSLFDCGFASDYASPDTIPPEIIQDNRCYSSFSGHVEDMPSDTNIKSGVYKLELDTNVSHNFIFDSFPYFAGPNKWDLRVIDLLKPAHARILATDSVGNTSSRDFDFVPTLFLTTYSIDEIIPTNIRRTDHIIWIKNTSDKPKSISRVMSNNGNPLITRYFVIDSSAFPAVIPPNDSVRFDVAFLNFSIDTVYNEILVRDTCGILFFIPVRFYSPIPVDSVSDITTVPRTIDFGTIKSNTDVTDHIVIRNNSLYFEAKVGMSLMQRTPNLFANGKYLLSPQQESSVEIYFYGGMLGKFHDTLVIQAVNGKKFLFPINVEVVSGTGLNDHSELMEDGITLDVIPNPAGSQAEISIDLKKPSTLSCQIMDIDGNIVRKIFENMDFRNGRNYYRINLESFSSGTYFIRIISQGKSYTRKFSIIR